MGWGKMAERCSNKDCNWTERIKRMKARGDQDLLWQWRPTQRISEKSSSWGLKVVKVEIGIETALRNFSNEGWTKIVHYALLLD